MGFTNALFLNTQKKTHYELLDAKILATPNWEKDPDKQEILVNVNANEKKEKNEWVTSRDKI